MKAARERTAADSGKLGRELLGLFAIFCGLLVILSLATFDSRDPWLNHVVSGTIKVRNKAGLFGAYLAGLLYDIFGSASWVLPAWFCLAGARRILGLASLPWWRWTGFLFLGLCVCLAGAAGDLGDVEIFARGVLPQGAGNVSTHGGGIIGHMIYVGLVGWMGATGAFLVWLFCLLLSFQMLTGISWLSLLVEGARSLHASLCESVAAMAERRAQRKEAARAAAQQGHIPEPLPVSVSGQGGTRIAAEIVAVQEPQYLPDLPASDPFEDEAEDRFDGRRNDHGANGQDFFTFPVRDERADNDPQRDDAFAAPRQDERAAVPDLFRSETPERPSLVHPALLRPEMEPEPEASHESPPEPVPDPLRETEAEKRGSALFAPARHEDEEEGLPPWVRDFEEGRIGVPGEAFEAPQAEQFAEASAPSASSDEDEDLISILWGKEEQQPQSTAREEEDAFAPDAAGLHAAHDTRPGPAPADDDAPPLLSAKTAAAVEALRSVGGVPPDAALYSSSPEYADAALAELAQARRREREDAAFPAASTNNVPQQAALSHPAATHQDAATAPSAPAGGQNAPSHPVGDAAAAPAPQVPSAPHTGGEPIHVFEAPPVAAAAKPGLVETLVQRVKRVVPLPPLDLLEAAPPAKGVTPRAVLEEKGRSLMTCLKDFGIQGELVGITPGPVVTMFEVRPAPGVRVSRIANLSDDLALALKAVAVRIQAPVPGTDTVGIEIPNETRETVCLKELLGSELFRQSKSLLTLALGKDIAGLPAVADLATMPHLLVAGATGAGKSVGINSIILSLIYKARPDQVKLLLVDPKRVEMAIYADLPHLVHPVVTEMQLAKNALEWAVSEMEQRYNAIARAGVRNIADYNAKVADWAGNAPEGLEDLERMPYLVVIIDELADLMLVAAKEVETSIVRLAQLARAAGIHLILATQRPSVDVVTGLIKANFPCRISFQVTSKHDSRTILDTVGAEQLLGRGDMLFKPPGGKFRRMHGAFVSDKNVNAVVDYWKRHLKPEYHVDFSDWAPEGAATGVLGGPGGNGGDVASDPLYNEAVEFVRQQGKASISLIQRKFRIGFNKAARFVEQMEQDGIIGPADGSKPRMVIR